MKHSDAERLDERAGAGQRMVAVMVEQTWTEICAVDRIPQAYGVAALLPDGTQVAVFRTADDEVLAVGNVDPISGAAVLSRGIVGDADGVPVVASPIFKERFDLRSGQCLDADDVSVPVYRAKVDDGVIYVGSSA